MNIERRTVLDQIEIKRDGTVQLRLAKQIVDGETVLTSEYHRTTFEPGTHLDAAIPVIEAHLTELGAALVSSDEWARVRRVVTMEHTLDVIAAVAAKREAAAQRWAPL
jgi:hypothetical protein